MKKEKMYKMHTTDNRFSNVNITGYNVNINKDGYAEVPGTIRKVLVEQDEWTDVKKEEEEDKKKKSSKTKDLFK